jgi:hypothetical protein
MSVPSFIYLIEAENGLVKIGRAQKVSDRVRAVRVHSPVLARLIAQWPGGADEEEALHVEFAAFRRHGEWFLMKGAFLSFVEISRGRGVDEIPSWGDLLFASRRNYWEHRYATRSNIYAERLRRGVKAAAVQVGLTPRQAECLAFIRAYIDSHGCSPSYQEIADGIGVVSKGHVHGLIHQLAARGHLAMGVGKNRAIVLVDALNTRGVAA